ncbi:type I polyketide synthase [Actinoplanes sp. N902-109]|uniref:type I polyketide synthase n=1 Tax=Actinoplanes sp. (strain N902-109) TaxID=649831 RepID=UPI00032965F2|nr:type I polyketide synthase [Actinoplanes sp. N902-109]AGL15852.1 beta-ketoacyl synthase [Actinoplanes sp. N902-109]
MTGPRTEPIAVVGVGLRFPGGSTTLDEFEQFLREGRSGIGPIPADRWDVAAFTPARPEEPGKVHTTGGGFLDRIDEFDAGFFNISPKEAQYIDPQQRMLLETAWQALEHANIDPATLRRGNGGVYVGASSIDYALEMSELPYAQLDGHLAAGITMFPLSGRLSYFLGWRGPSISVDTACSSSLTALHLAVQALRGGECDIALVGGVNALHHPRIPVIFSNGRMLAPDARCKTFDDAADGYVRAEGCGVVVLTRLGTARSEGHEVMAVIRGTAVGQDGDSAGLTVPNGTAQTAVMRQAIAAAGLTPADIQYVEAHGTGTPLGDPIEMGAINDVFAGTHDRSRPLLVGSVKTNLGHMEPASGIVGLIKAALQVRTGTIYAHLNLTTPSGRIPWNVYPVEVPTSTREWPAGTRRAVVNSFGFAGTIAAVVVEQAPEPAPMPQTAGVTGEQLFTLSAKGGGALTAQARSYLRFLEQNPGTDLARLCFTGAARRTHHSNRFAAVVRDLPELRAALEQAAGPAAPAPATAVRKVALLFSGQGAQYAGMGTALYERFPVFRRHVDECDALFAGHLGRSVRELLLDEVPGAAGLINETWVTQPALFTFEYALAQLWMSWGVRPAVLIGHSIGEVVAAAVAGVFSLADATLLVAARALLMQSVPQTGGMAAVSAPAEEVAPLLADRPELSLAAVNAPAQCVISGATGDLEAVISELKERRVRVERLAVSHAFHSPLMLPAIKQFRDAIAGIAFHAPAVPLVSNVTGAIARPSELTNPDYWARHIGEPVRFLDGIRTIARRGRHAMIEVGPSGTLVALGRQGVPPTEQHVWLPSVSRRIPGVATILRSLGELYRAGGAVAWRGFYEGRPVAPIALPPYEFQRKRYWLPAPEGQRSAVVTGTGRHPLLGTERRVDGVREFAVELTAGTPLHGDYTRDGAVVLPPASYLELFAALQNLLYGHEHATTAEMRLHEPLCLATDAPVAVRTRVTQEPDGTANVRVLSGDETLHATAVLRDDAPSAPAAAPPTPVTGGRRTAEGVHVDLASAGHRYGPRLRTLRQVTLLGDGLHAEVDVPEATFGEHVPVAVLAGAVQAFGALDPEREVVAAEAVRLYRRPRGATADVRVSRRAPAAGADPAELVADVLLTQDGQPVMELRGLVLSRPADPGAGRAFEHRLAWEPVGSSAPAAMTAPHVLAVQASDAQLGGLAGVRVSAAAPDALTGALSDPTVTDVAWFWRRSEAPVEVASLRAEAEENYTGLLHLISALQAAGRDDPPRLWLVTERAQMLPGDPADAGQPLGAATLWGFGATVRTEYPQFRPVLVDLGGGADLTGLAREWAAPAGSEFALAFRSGQRYVQRLSGGPGEPGADTGVRVRDDRTYVITGGLGGLGLATAGKLVELGARHLTLVSRSGTPAAEAAGLLDELRERADVRLVRADLANPLDVDELVAGLRAGGLPVGGFVHAAGAVGKELVAKLDWPAIDEQFGPKVYGGWLLHRASTAFPEHEFFVLYSSIAAVIGGATQAHYAGASAFLDHLAGWRAALGLPALSVSWGAWAEVGMSARLDDQLSAEVDRSGIRFFSVHRALDTLAGLLHRPVSHRIVGRYDWPVLGGGVLRNALYDHLPRAESAEQGPDLRRLLSEPGADPAALLGRLVRDTVAGALHLGDPGDLDPTVDFMSLGLDSLMALEVRTTLEAAARIPLPASLTFDHPSPLELTRFLIRRLGPAPSPEAS